MKTEAELLGDCARWHEAKAWSIRRLLGGQLGKLRRWPECVAFDEYEIMANRHEKWAHALRSRDRDDCGPALFVTQDSRGRFECVRDGESGSCVAGRGASVLEAVGAWAIYSQKVSILCKPPAVLRDYAVATDYDELSFKDAPSRD